jgi:selenocysteine lyase/cysteine desulfurase
MSGTGTQAAVVGIYLLAAVVGDAPATRWYLLAFTVPTVAVTIAGHTPRVLATALGERGIFAWDGNYYALALMERLGLEASGGALRLGLAHYNTIEEVDRVVAALRELVAS